MCQMNINMGSLDSLYIYFYFTKLFQTLAFSQLLQVYSTRVILITQVLAKRYFPKLVSDPSASALWIYYCTQLTNYMTGTDRINRTFILCTMDIHLFNRQKPLVQISVELFNRANALFDMSFIIICIYTRKHTYMYRRTSNTHYQQKVNQSLFL